MPEELEPQGSEEFSEQSEELSENQSQESEPEGEETEKKGPKHIPYERFQEVWNERQDARQYAQNLQMQILQMQQQLSGLAASANQPKMPDVDPDVENIVAPVLQKHMGPLLHQLQQAKAELASVQARNEADAAWQYVLQHVPDMDDLKDDLAKEIESKSPVIQRKITSDPDLVIEMAEKVRLRRASGQTIQSQKAKADIRGRTRSESGGPGTNPSKSGNNIDWLSLSDEEFAKAEAQLQQKRRGY